jgi:hypothetical protein
MAATLIAVTLLACYIPARRAEFRIISFLLRLTAGLKLPRRMAFVYAFRALTILFFRSST